MAFHCEFCIGLHNGTLAYPIHPLINLLFPPTFSHPYEEKNMTRVYWHYYWRTAVWFQAQKEAAGLQAQVAALREELVRERPEKV